MSKAAVHCALHSVPTSRGLFHLVSSSQGLLRLFFPEVSQGQIRLELKKSGAILGESLPPWIECARDQLAGFFEGDVTEFTLPLDDSRASPFQRKIYGALKAVPYGETVSYGELGRQVGYLRGARAVGTAMRCNSVPIVVPCHRVVRAGGGTGGWSGPPGWKEELLMLESQRKKALVPVAD